eukprot:gene24633-biopygen5949
MRLGGSEAFQRPHRGIERHARSDVAKRHEEPNRKDVKEHRGTVAYASFGAETLSISNEKEHCQMLVYLWDVAYTQGWSTGNVVRAAALKIRRSAALKREHSSAHGNTGIVVRTAALKIRRQTHSRSGACGAVPGETMKLRSFGLGKPRFRAADLSKYFKNALRGKARGEFPSLAHVPPVSDGTSPLSARAPSGPSQVCRAEYDIHRGSE